MMVIVFIAASTFLGADIAALLRDGGTGGAALPLVLLGAGLGTGFAFSPILNSAMAHVALADTPDASGLLTSLMQLGSVIGIASYGSFFLTIAGHGGPHPTATAESDTLFLVAGGILGAAISVSAMLRALHKAHLRNASFAE